jgi:hypothetical protein
MPAISPPGLHTQVQERQIDAIANPFVRCTRPGLKVGVGVNAGIDGVVGGYMGCEGEIVGLLT